MIVKLTSAQEAGQQIDTIVSDKAQAQMAMIESKIQEAIKSHNKTIHIYETILPCVKKAITEAGYIITQDRHDQRDGYILTFMIEDN